MDGPTGPTRDSCYEQLWTSSYHPERLRDHSFDGLTGEPAHTKRLTLIDELASLRGITMDYGMSAIELGTSEHSDNWHIHIAFKGKYNCQTAATTLQNYMKKQYPKTFPSAR